MFGGGHVTGSTGRAHTLSNGPGRKAGPTIARTGTDTVTPRKYGSRTRRLSVKVTPEIDDALRAEAARQDAKLSDLLVQALAKEFGVELPRRSAAESVFE